MYKRQEQNWPLFLRGAGNTLLIALTGTIIGFIIGIIIGVIRTIPVDHNTTTLKKGILKVVDILLLCYIEVFRGTPMMVQAMVVFYGIAMVYGIHLNPIPAGIVIVSINTGAYMAEIVRGGILSIDKGQFEAAHAIGMTHAQTMTSIIPVSYTHLDVYKRQYLGFPFQQFRFVFGVILL